VISVTASNDKDCTRIIPVSN